MAKKKENLENEDMTQENTELEENVGNEENVAESFDVDVSTIPTLATLSVGDTISFRVEKISEDGNTYTLTPIVEQATETLPTGEGRQEVARALL